MYWWHPHFQWHIFTRIYWMQWFIFFLIFLHRAFARAISMVSLNMFKVCEVFTWFFSLTCRWINYLHWEICTEGCFSLSLSLFIAFALCNNTNTLPITWMIYRVQVLFFDIFTRVHVSQLSLSWLFLMADEWMNRHFHFDVYENESIFTDCTELLHLNSIECIHRYSGHFNSNDTHT